MTDLPSTPYRLKTLLVLMWSQGTWLKETTLMFPPFPKLGIRLDVYDLLVVDFVEVGLGEWDVVCMCSFEGGGNSYTEARVRAFGFERGVYV